MESQMKVLIEKFPAQLNEALAIASKANLHPLKTPVSKVIICGLGGSGIGGTLVKEILFNQARVPVEVIKHYTLPSYLDEHCLVICSSYSGNTEETLESCSIAQNKNAKVVCVTSGGKLLKMAKENGDDYILLPGGMPPRTCLGYSLTQLLHILSHYGFSESTHKHIESAAELLIREQEHIKNDAAAIAERIGDKLPVIYSSALHEGVAIRLRQQFNENAKILSWHHVIPEMNHNELVGWSHPYENLAVILFTDKNENPRNKLRIEFCKRIFYIYASELIEIPGKGTNEIEKKFYWIHLGDWISLYLSEHRKVDAMEVNIIDKLKHELTTK